MHLSSPHACYVSQLSNLSSRNAIYIRESERGLHPHCFVKDKVIPVLNYAMMAYGGVDV
jgi:hypothetical protein